MAPFHPTTALCNNLNVEWRWVLGHCNTTNFEKCNEHVRALASLPLIFDSNVERTRDRTLHDFPWGMRQLESMADKWFSTPINRESNGATHNAICSLCGKEWPSLNSMCKITLPRSRLLKSKERINRARTTIYMEFCACERRPFSKITSQRRRLALRITHVSSRCI